MAVADLNIKLIPELETAVLNKQLKEVPNLFNTLISTSTGRARDLKGRFVGAKKLAEITERSKEFGEIFSKLGTKERVKTLSSLIGYAQGENPRLSTKEAARFVQETVALGGYKYNPEDDQEPEKQDKEKPKEKKEKKKEQDAMKNFSKSLNTFSSKMGFRGLGSFLTNPYMLVGGAIGYGLKQLNARANDIYAKRATYGGQYSYTLREAMENTLIGGKDADKTMNAFYSRFANLKSDLELGFVEQNIGTIGAVARATQGDSAAMNALMEGDMVGLFNAILNKAESYNDINKARSLASHLGLPEEEFMKILKNKKGFQARLSAFGKLPLETKGDVASEFYNKLKQVIYDIGTFWKTDADDNLIQEYLNMSEKKSGYGVNDNSTNISVNGNVIVTANNTEELGKTMKSKLRTGTQSVKK